MYFQRKIGKPDAFGVYLHVPFCASTCDFCSFYQKLPKRKDLELYLEGIIQEIKTIKVKKHVDTIFWGGGTPGLLSIKNLELLGYQLIKSFLSYPSEWTIEMTPSTVNPKKVKALLDMGVTRISMGVQSFQPETLKELGRAHKSKQIYKAYEILRSQGCKNINLDLIFAIPGQSMNSWELDLIEAKKLEPEHISTYCLTFEEDTPLYLKLSQGKVQIDFERELAFYKKTWEFLNQNEYMQYEISNFSRIGFECEHNLNTWAMSNWLGLGPSACSQYMDKRFSNPISIDAWHKKVFEKKIKKENFVILTDKIKAIDSLIFGLRMNAGIDLQELSQRFPKIYFGNLNSYWRACERAKLLKYYKERISLTNSGRLLADRIGADLLEIF